VVTRIRLRVAERPLLTPCSYRDPRLPTAPPISLPLLRLTAPAIIQAPPGASRPGRSVAALIDTGCCLSVVERKAWLDFETAGLLEHLPFGDANPQTTSVADHTTEFRLGRLWVALIDPTPTSIVSLPVVPVVAQLLQQPTPALERYPLILGLHRGVLDGRKLTREVALSPPGSPPPAPSTDCGAWYGQEWHFESA
jgi:hypothetical protein